MSSVTGVHGAHLPSVPVCSCQGGKGHRAPSLWLPGRRQKGREAVRGGEGRLALALRCVDFHPDTLPAAGAQAGMAQLPALGGRVEQGLFPGRRLGRSTSHSSS